MRIDRFVNTPTSARNFSRRRRAITVALGMAMLMTAPCAAQPNSKAVKAAPAGASGRDIDHMIRYSATGLALPNEPVDADVILSARGARAWRVEGGDRLLLDGEVYLSIGSYAFRADRAAVILYKQQRPGLVVDQVVVYLDQVRELGGYGPIAQSAPRLMVTAVITGRITLKTDLMKREPADGDELMRTAVERLRRYQANVAARTVPVPGGPPLIDHATFVNRAYRRAQLRDEEPVVPPVAPDDVTVPPVVTPAVPPQPGVEPVPRVAPTPEAPPGDYAVTQQVDFTAARVDYRKVDDETVILLLGEIQVMYVDRVRNWRLTLTANKGVIFLDPEAGGDALSRSADARAVRGVYLEDNVVVTDGQYTLRGPRVFYDLQTDKAVVLDAVFYTWDVKHQVPIYVRAEHLRQHSRQQWSAGDAVLTTSEFYEPHFSIGVKNLTINASTQPDQTNTHDVAAEGVTLNVGKQPIFYWPSVSGDATDVPIQSVTVGGSDRRGGILQTRWDLFALANKKAPTGFDASLLIDGYTKRGPAVGIEADYDVPNAFGDLETYYLYDKGEDEPGGRNDIEPQEEHRGRALWRHRHELADDWEATVEFAWLSDPTLLEEFFPDQANASKEYETVFYLKQQREDWAFSFLAKYDLMDFVANNDILQTRGNIITPTAANPTGADVGYTTHKLPEIAYYRVGTSLWDDRLSWYSENRASAMRLNLPQDTPAERGFNAAESLALFGMAAPATTATPFDAVARANGLDQETRYRADTRQEIAAPLNLGSINLTPYAVGRVTAYDDDFNNYAGSDDKLRFWGSLGARASTAISQSYDDVESRIFDLHRMRHVIEPHAHAFYAETTTQQDELPVYDYDVESLTEGGMVRLGVRNTFQTQRGGPGNWRSVDWLRIDTDFIIASNESDRESAIARFFDYRPEHSLVGDHMWNQVAWQVTDTFSAIGDVNYSFDQSEIERFTIGGVLDHTPRLATFVQYRDIDELDSSIIRYGWDYILTPKYNINFAQSYDLEENRTRSITLTVTRRLPRWLLMVAVDFDTVTDVSSFGIALAPEGLGSSGRVSNNPFLADALSRINQTAR